MFVLAVVLPLALEFLREDDDEGEDEDEAVWLRPRPRCVILLRESLEAAGRKWKTAPC